jgi:hypothetical protein
MPFGFIAEAHLLSTGATCRFYVEEPTFFKSQGPVQKLFFGPYKVVPVLAGQRVDSKKIFFK